MGEPIRWIDAGDGAAAAVRNAPPSVPIRSAAPSAMDQILDHLLSRAFLYEHPADYRSGVQAAVALLRDGSSR